MSEETQVIAGARIVLLQSLAWVERYGEKVRAGEGDANVLDLRSRRPIPEGSWPTHVPLFVEEWKDYSRDDIHLAARECAKLGEIEYDPTGKHPNGPMVRITPKGIAWIEQHDEELGR